MVSVFGDYQRWRQGLKRQVEHRTQGVGVLFRLLRRQEAPGDLEHVREPTR